MSDGTYHRSEISDDMCNDCQSQFVKLKIPIEQIGFPHQHKRQRIRDHANSDFELALFEEEKHQKSSNGDQKSSQLKANGCKKCSPVVDLESQKGPFKQVQKKHQKKKIYLIESCNSSTFNIS